MTGNSQGQKEGPSVTLIEIVVAFAIVGVIAAVFSPTTRRAHDSGDSDATVNLKAGRVIIVTSDSAALRVVVDGKIIAAVGDTISQPFGTTKRYTVRPRKGIDFCPSDVKIETPNQRVCIRCDAVRGAAQEIRCK